MTYLIPTFYKVITPTESEPDKTEGYAIDDA